MRSRVIIRVYTAPDKPRPVHEAHFTKLGLARHQRNARKSGAPRAVPERRARPPLSPSVQPAPYIFPFTWVGFLEAAYREPGDDVPVYRHASAFLIRDKFILTAAHALTPLNAQQGPTEVRFHLWKRPGSRRLTAWRIHPDCAATPPARYTYDIAVGRLVRGYEPLRENPYRLLVRSLAQAERLTLKPLGHGDRLEQRVTCIGYTDAHSGMQYASVDMEPWPRRDFDRSWPIFYPKCIAGPTVSGGPLMITREGWPYVVGVVAGQTTIDGREWSVAAPILTETTESFIRHFIREHTE
jgi:hypothetical protein